MWEESGEGLWPTAGKELNEAYKELNPANNHMCELGVQSFPVKSRGLQWVE